MRVPEWEGSSCGDAYPSAASTQKPSRKQKRPFLAKRDKELQRLIAGTVVLKPHAAAQVTNVAAGPAADRSDAAAQNAGCRGADHRHFKDTDPRKAAKQKKRGKRTIDRAEEAGRVSKNLRAEANPVLVQPPRGSKAEGRKIQSVAAASQSQKKNGAAEILQHSAPIRSPPVSGVSDPGAINGSAQLSKKAMHRKQQTQPIPSADVHHVASEPESGPNSDQLHARKLKRGLLGNMQARLLGSRFRWLNEQLYTQPGNDSFQLMQQDPAMFRDYHKGFREQTLHWPQQPLDAAVAWVSRLPTAAVIADFGCGIAQLARRVQHRVISLDLVATAPDVLACDMAHTPLGDSSVDAVVFCLALMGTNYGDFISEALRVLCCNGRMWIAEVRSRFVNEQGKEDHGPFQAALHNAGLSLTRQDTSSNRMFVVFEARKAGNSAAPGSSVSWPQLRACAYKRR